MKIFYAVQATGNGHISRAAQIYPELKKFGEVDFFLSGNNANLNPKFPVRFRSKGWSLHYSNCGGLNRRKMATSFRPLHLIKTAKSLPLQQYDVVINDFDLITSLACKLKKIPSVQFGHQASFQFENVPRPSRADRLGEFVLRNYSTSDKYVGLHFRDYNTEIKPPIIKTELIEADPRNDGHITIYLPSVQQHCIENALLALPDMQFHWFLPTIQSPVQVKNIHYFPIDNDLFSGSLLNCAGLLCGAGFETPAEALYLNKRLMVVPIKKHYEQLCNAAALEKIGVKVLLEIDNNLVEEIKSWLALPNLNYRQQANNIPDTLQYIFDTYPQIKGKMKLYQSNGGHDKELQESMLFI